MFLDDETMINVRLSLIADYKLYYINVNFDLKISEAKRNISLGYFSYFRKKNYLYSI